jgi:nucleotide-binding universal stress UspA family protein
MRKSVVIAYDGSEAAKRALERAVELGTNGSQIQIVAVAHLMPQVKGAATVVDPIEVEHVRQELAEAVKFLEKHGVTSKAIEGHGDPADVIVRAAKDADADLVIVGTSGRGAIGRSLLGSVSTKVVHHAPCDVLVVR